MFKALLILIVVKPPSSFIRKLLVIFCRYSRICNFDVVIFIEAPHFFTVPPVYDTIIEIHIALCHQSPVFLTLRNVSILTQTLKRFQHYTVLI